MKDFGIINRTALVDSPIVEMLLANKYRNSNISFLKRDREHPYITCVLDGVKKLINVKRNSARHYDSQNFSIIVDKNNLSKFKNSSFAFIDETADAIYFVDGDKLLTYIVEHKNRINVPEHSTSKMWVTLPKSDMVLISRSTIKYNKHIAHLFELNRDESKFSNLI